MLRGGDGRNRIENCSAICIAIGKARVLATPSAGNERLLSTVWVRWVAVFVGRTRLFKRRTGELAKERRG